MSRLGNRSLFTPTKAEFPALRIYNWRRAPLIALGSANTVRSQRGGGLRTKVIFLKESVKKNSVSGSPKIDQLGALKLGPGFGDAIGVGQHLRSIEMRSQAGGLPN